jgi:hypothetical protein
VPGCSPLSNFRLQASRRSGDHILQSSTGTVRIESFGTGSDRSQPVDFDADGKTDLAVTREAGGVYTWYVWKSSTSSLLALVFGLSTDIPLSQYLTR